MKNVDNLIYYSKVNWWLILSIVILPGLAVIYSSFSETHELLNSFIAGFWVFLGLSTIILVLGCPTKYTLTDKGLRIHTGIFLSWKIPYDRIIDAYPVYSIWAAPALSFERVHITLKRRALFFLPFNDFVEISPKNRENFLEELKIKIKWDF